MIRIAFTLLGGKGWTGGHNYLDNMLRVLGGEFQDRVTPVLFVAEEVPTDRIETFNQIEGIEIVRSSLLNSGRARFSLLQALILGRDLALRKLFRTQQINLVFEAAQFYGWRLGLPAIAWIPDFQHLALPDMFSTRARLKRDFGFRMQMLGRRTIMLSSEDARRTCLSHYPVKERNTMTVHFAVPAGTEIDSSETRAIADGYDLPEHFFYIPNQMWKHKNHALVVEALALLGERGISIVVAVSGSQNDPRDPEIFARIQALVDRLEVADNIRFLGLIPYPHVGALMRASSALINPSLCEGWSTTVEEARAMGVPMLLSDLDVHREQMGDQALYFDRFSPTSLADSIEHFHPLDASQRRQLTETASLAAQQRVTEFGENFTSLVEACVGQAVKS